VLLTNLLSAKRSTKRLISLLYDALAISLALYLCIALRTGELTIAIDKPTILSFAITLCISLAVFIRLGLYRAILRYSPQEALTAIALGAGFSATSLASSSFFLSISIPRSSPIIFVLAALILLGTPRLLIRSLVRLNKNGRTNSQANAESVIIYGAGYSGYQLALSLANDNQYKVVAFIDDNPKLTGSKLRNISVYKPRKLEEIAFKYGVSSVLLAIGTISRSQRATIVKRLEKASLKALTIPPIHDILTGKARIEDLKPIAIEELLGRDPVPAKNDLLHACITGKVVMVTGGGGSIGSELCRQIIRQKPTRLVLFELNEYSLYRIEQELKNTIELNCSDTCNACELIPLIGSVQNQNRLETIMSTFGVQTVYHAAAYKHVPLVEHNIVEGVRNNIFGTWYCAEAAIKAKVESFVLVSTDKAVRPTNIMGTSKRVAELVLQGLSQRQNNTRFTMVRFGNVLGSSGSVAPLFRKQIKNGGPITVTHPDIIRYFMTIPEAAELVIQAGSMGEGGDVFVLDMGDPVKITDLAKRMIHLSGLELKDDNNPDGDVEIKFSGLRPGEKLYEELLIGDNVSGTQHPRIMRAEEKTLNWAQTQKLLNELDHACSNFQCEQVKQLLLEAPTDYQSNSNIQDWVWSHKNSKLRLITN
jgi:UDP-N-acetylglucosamine 4,6-dehydratase